MMDTGPEEGSLDAQGLKIFYKSYGTRGPKGSLVCLHGGPGGNHLSQVPLADLAQFGYHVVFYDQMGCGKSELPRNKALYTVERHVEEVEAVRRELKLGRIHLTGSSWGGDLTLAYALKYQRNLRSIVVASGCSSVPFNIAETERLKSKLPDEIRQIMNKYEATGEYDNPEYKKAEEYWDRTYLCRLPVWPRELVESMQRISKPIYETMWGPNEFTCTGTLRYWDITDRLHQIKIPTLIIVGRYDEVTPECARKIHRGIKGSKVVVFENSSHTAKWEEREKYIKVLRRFLDRVSAGKRS